MKFFGRRAAPVPPTCPPGENFGPEGEVWSRLLSEARAGSFLRHSPLHGECHWRAVAAIGLNLSMLRPDLEISRKFIVAFGILHDCRREDEAFDSEHGARAAELAKASRPLEHILRRGSIEDMVRACRLHDKGQVDPDNSNVGACWDADRYALARLEIRPDPALMSLGLGEEDHLRMISDASRLSRMPPSWEILVATATDMS